MLSYAAFAAIVAGILFLVNGTTWFASEENLAVPLIVIGVVIFAIQAVLTALAFRAFSKHAERIESRFPRF